LLACQQVYEDQGDLARLAKVLAARAGLEAQRGNLAAALVLQQTAIRFNYTRPDPDNIAAGHNNLAVYLDQTGSDPAAQRAHRLAAAPIRQLTGMAYGLANTIRALAGDLRRDTGGQHLPVTLEEVIAAADQTEGVHFGQLITALQPDRQAAADALTQI